MTCDPPSAGRRSPEDPGAATDPATLVRNWREAASLLEAACAVVATYESPETVAIQDAANLRATEAFAALAAVTSLDPVVLRAHADALEWLMVNFGALSDGRGEPVLGHAIADELRALAAERDAAGRP